MEWLLVAWLILASSNWAVECLMHEPAGDRLAYSGTELLQLREGGIPPPPNLLSCVPRELLRQPGQARRRGEKGGVRQWVRKAAKLPLPSILLCNARSLRRKLDELRTQAKVSYEYRESGLLVFTDVFTLKTIGAATLRLETKYAIPIWNCYASRYDQTTCQGSFLTSLCVLYMFHQTQMPPELRARSRNVYTGIYRRSHAGSG